MNITITTKCPCETYSRVCCACVSMHCDECHDYSKFKQGRYCSNCGRPLEAELSRNYVPKSEVDKLEYTLLGVMHSVDKWLDGEELEQDEVNRAATMREKTLRIVENAKREASYWMSMYMQETSGKLTASALSACEYYELIRQLQLKEAKAEAIKEFAEKLEKRLYDKPSIFTQQRYIVDDEINHLVKEMTEGKTDEKDM